MGRKEGKKERREGGMKQGKKDGEREEGGGKEKKKDNAARSRQ